MAAFVAAATALASAHELFLHPRGFFLSPQATITLPVLNGTFTRSENAVERARLVDLSIAGPDGRRAVERAAWTEREPQSTVRIGVGGPGTYVVSAAIGERTIALEAAEFNRYLAEEGITPILEQRRASGRAGRRARESYAKAAKTLLAVTDAAGHLLPRETLRAGSAAVRPLGTDAEIVPLVDPYALGVGETLPVRALVGGRPLARWTIHAGGTVGTSAVAIPKQTLATDADGRADVRLTHDGHWFVAFVHMREAEPGAAVDYVSRWATLTFGVLPAGTR